MNEHAEVIELEQAVEQMARVAAIDIAKSSAQKTWPVTATSELADHMVCPQADPASITEPVANCYCQGQASWPNAG